MKYKFIDIGCGHIDVSSDIFGTDVVGMYVEPIKEYLSVLPSGPNIIKENCVISDIEGSVSFNAIVPNSKHIKYFSNKEITRIFKNKRALQKYINLYRRSGNSSLYEYENNKDVTQKINVESLTLKTLFKKHNVTEIDYLKIDVEGAEHIILNQLNELLNERKIIINYQIKFEYNDLSDKKILNKLITEIKINNNFESKFENTIFWNEDMVLTKININEK